MPDRPADVGLRSYGSAPDTPEPSVAPRTGLLAATFGALRRAARTRTFWYLFATFFVCGFTTNGLVGTHLIALCGDHGIAEVQAAGLLALMGIFDLVGTTASGWLTDRYDPRRLLFVYYNQARGAISAAPAATPRPRGSSRRKPPGPPARAGTADCRWPCWPSASPSSVRGAW